ncbi:MAG: hypothetical protein R2719_15100 [Micropruina sp.]
MVGDTAPHLRRSICPASMCLFLETGYHFAETVQTRDALAAAAPVRIVDVLLC